MGGGGFYVPMFRANDSLAGRASPLYTCSTFALRCPSLFYQALLSLFLSKGLTVYANTTRTRKAESEVVDAVDSILGDKPPGDNPPTENTFRE